MNKKTIAGILGLAALLTSAANGQDLARQKKRLEAEYELAKSPTVYVVFDGSAKAISLRVRGLTLKTWPAAKIRTWGRPVGIGSLKVVKRTGWSAQDRVNITPGIRPEAKADDKKAKDIGSDVLEINDMPWRYEFRLERDVRISVRTRPKGVLGWTGGVFAGIGRGLGRSARILWSAVRGREFSEIWVLVSDRAEAQGIFWSVPEGTRVLFY